MKIVRMTMLSLLLLMVALPTYAAGRLTRYCSPQIGWCELMVNEFEKRTGINVRMTRKSSGETLAQIRAEKSNPKGDVWWGGCGVDGRVVATSPRDWTFMSRRGQSHNATQCADRKTPAVAGVKH